MQHSNIQGELIFPEENYVKYIPKVTETAAINPDGTVNENSLFDPLIFGTPGSDDRMLNLGAIALNVHVLHPMVAVYLEEVSTIYKSVWEGSVKVKLEKGELIPDQSGETGYTYFLSVLDKLKLPEKESRTRSYSRKSILKYRQKGILTNNYLIVMAAGLREFTIDDGRVTMDEINEMYTRIMYAASTAGMLDTDATRLHLHNQIHDLYKHILTLISGKKKAMNAHLARNYTYGSRNVITGQVMRYKTIDEIPIDIVDRFTIGLNQYLKNIEPVVIHFVVKRFFDNSILINRAFIDGVPKHIEFTSATMNKFDKDNITKLIEEFQLPAFRHTPVLFDGNPMAYVDIQGTKVDIYLPNDTDKDGMDLIPPQSAHPMTYGEMFFVAIADKVEELGIMATRYPIANENSSVVGKVILETTIKNTRLEQRVSFKSQPVEFDTFSFPVLNDDWHESFVIPYFRLSGYGADFDGDGLSSGNLMTKEANDNIDERLNSIQYYKSFDLDISDKPADFCMLTLTKD